MVHLNLRRFVIASLLLPLVAASGCNPTNTSPTTEASPPTQTAASTDQSLRVVATFLPVYLFTKAVAGEAATVDILIQPGTEVHEYQSTPADVRSLAGADVVVKNGLGMEEFLDATVKSAENPRLKIIDASQGVQPVGEVSPVVSATGTADDDHDHDHDKEAGGKADAHTHAAGNPHVWLDPMLAKKQVENIRDGLIAADPANQATYQTNAAAYIQKLSNLNNQFEQRLKPFKNRTFITFHDAFPYLANRYQLQQVAVVAIPEDQLAPGDVQKTIAAVERFQAKALFSEPGVDNKLLTGLSQDLNVKVYALDSLESGKLDPAYYFTAMQNNLETLATAFE